MDEWDSLLDPYQESLQEGYHEGRQAGLQSGYNDGWHLGKIKALEIGIELGYMQSIATKMLDSLLSESEFRQEVERGDPQTERKIKRLGDFLELVRSFSAPDDIFNSWENNSMNAINETAALNAHETKEGDNESRIDLGGRKANDPPGSTQVDITEQLQRIRAKYKTILVQMKVPHLALKKVLNERIVEHTIGEKIKEGTTTIDDSTGASTLSSSTTQQTSVYQDNDW